MTALSLLPRLVPPLSILDRPVVAESILLHSTMPLLAVSFRRNTEGVTRTGYGALGQAPTSILIWSPSEHSSTQYDLTTGTVGTIQNPTFPEESEWTIRGPFAQRDTTGRRQRYGLEWLGVHVSTLAPEVLLTDSLCWLSREFGLILEDTAASPEGELSWLLTSLRLEEPRDDLTQSPLL